MWGRHCGSIVTPQSLELTTKPFLAATSPRVLARTRRMSTLARDASVASMLCSSNVALETRSSDPVPDVNFHFTSLHLAHTTATSHSPRALMYHLLMSKEEILRVARFTRVISKAPAMYSQGNLWPLQMLPFLASDVSHPETS